MKKLIYKDNTREQMAGRLASARFHVCALLATAPVFSRLTNISEVCPAKYEGTSLFISIDSPGRARTVSSAGTVSSWNVI